MPTISFAPNEELAQESPEPDPRPMDKSNWQPVIPLRGVVQHYAWGKPWDTSLVAAMATNQVRSRRSAMRAPPLNRGQRWAELWMGTHPNGPSSVVLPVAEDGQSEAPVMVESILGTGTPAQYQAGAPVTPKGASEEWYLEDAIKEDPHYWLGEDHSRRNIPFLFKVLSVRQALSIQAHPNKTLAEKLHKAHPMHYPDDNHKPEIALPLGHFEALCGFRPFSEVLANIRSAPELEKLCIKDGVDPESEGLRVLYSRLMRSDQDAVRSSALEMLQRLQGKEDRSKDEDLVVRVARDYPGDSGLFSIFFLNYVQISEDMPHHFIFCAPDEPHAYLLGDCVECMSLSDNVVRAGLTSKHKDVEVLLDMMTYKDDLLDKLVNVGECEMPNVIKYDPPVEDFVVYEITGAVKDGLHLKRAAIIACLDGACTVSFLWKDCNGSSEVKADVEHPLPWESLRIEKGHTFFSRAGTLVCVLDMAEGSKLFVATY